MSGKIAVFKGAPRWRDWSFWQIIALFCAAMAWSNFRSHSVWPAVMWSPLYLVHALPRRAWLASNFLITNGSSGIFWKFHRFDRIESYSYLDVTKFGLPQPEGDVDVSLILINEKKRKKAQTAMLTVQIGSSVNDFIRVMQERQVPSLLQTLNETFAAPPIFNPPFSDLEAERDALYALLARRKPELKW